MIDTTAQKRPFHLEVAEKLVGKLQKGDAPWQKPLDGRESPLPVNPITGRRFHGVNAVTLMMEGRDDPRWLTFNQAREAGYRVKPGERGTHVQIWTTSERVDKIDPVTGRPELDAKGKPVQVEIELEKPKVIITTVFNASQLTGIPPHERKPSDWDPHERAGALLANSGVAIKHDQRDRSFYSPMFDAVHMPAREKFPDPDKYYEAALHNLAKATGHESRLNRDTGGQFGTPAYAREELVASIATMFVCADLGIANNPGRNAAQVNAWIAEIRNHPMEVCRVAQQAERAATELLSLERSHEQSQQRDNSERLPRWVGQLEVRACKENERGEVVSQGVAAEQAEFHGVYARLEDGAEQLLRDFDQAEDAREYASTLEGERRREERNAALAPPAAVNLGYIDVPFDDRLEAKKLGAEFDADAKSWYIPEGVDPKPLLEKWPRHDPALTRAGLEAARAERMATEREGRLYIDVPRREKDEAKALGARWDRDARSWYVPEGVNPEPLLARWPAHNPLKEKPLSKAEIASEAGRIRDSLESGSHREKGQELVVAFKDNDKVKGIADWDAESGCWRARPGADPEKLHPFLPNDKASIEPPLTPREEFAEVLKSIGAKVEEPHPVMDKKPHRIETEGDERGEKSGFYVCHPDGRPAGYAIDNRSKQERYWAATGHVMDDRQRSDLRNAAMKALEERRAQLAKMYDRTAETLRARYAGQKPPNEPTPYMKAKGIALHDGVFSSGKTTCVPAYTANGTLRSVQYIQEDGTKRFAKNSEREGCFHAVGGLDALGKAPVIIIAEGYATAASIREATGRPVVAAFDAGNLAAVAKALKEAMPNKPIVIAGDDDRGLEDRPGGNVGRKYALAAAEAVGGKAVFPVFAPGEAGRGSKGFTDFNDLAAKSPLGKEAVRSQIETVLELQREKDSMEIEKAKEQGKDKEQSKGRGRD